MKTHLTRYIFKSAVSDDTCRSYGDTESRARERIGAYWLEAHKPGAPEIEIVPYAHAPLVAGIIRALGAGWDASPVSEEHADCNWFLRHENGMEIFFGKGWGAKGKWAISYCARSDKSRSAITVYNEKSERVPPPSIGVSMEKTAEQIAKDIERRLLSDCRNYFVAESARLDASNGYLTKAETAKETAARINTRFGSRYGFRADSGGSKDVTLSLRLSPEDAERLAAYVVANFNAA